MKTHPRKFLYLPVIFAFCGILGCAGPRRCAVSKGDKAPDFTANSLQGQAINFPNDYKGKIVMLDFWASWCPLCRKELPNVSAAFEKYHGKGFEIVGVSLDEAQQRAALQQFVQEHKMTWPEIYDGGYWKAAIAQQYSVRSIPCPVLVDGDSGTVLAAGGDAVGERLTAVLDKALANKSSAH